MNKNTMEGLIGARTNTNLMDTPMRVFNEASSKGDTAAMERAIGYAGECADKAEEYKTKADKGMEEEARTAREKAKLQREEAIQKRKEESKKLEERIEESRRADTNTDSVEISEEGKASIKDNIDLGPVSSQEIREDAVEEPVTYTKTGEVIHTEPSDSISVSA